MTRLITLTFFFTNIILAFGQNSINGTYSRNGTKFVFKNNFDYEFTASSCMSNTSDFGKYELKKDTIIFHSSLRPEDIINKEIFITTDWDLNTKRNKMDTILISVKNKTDFNKSFPVDIYIRDSLIFHTDSLKVNETKNYKYFSNILSDSMYFTITVNNIKTTELAAKYNNYIIYSRYSKSEPFKEKMIYCGNKIYSVSVHDLYKKKFYIYRQKEKIKENVPASNSGQKQ